MFELYQSGKRGGPVGPYKGQVSYSTRPLFSAQLSCPSRAVLRAMMQDRFFEPEPGPTVSRYRMDSYRALSGGEHYDTLALRKIRRALAGTRPIGLRITHYQQYEQHYSVEEVQAMKQVVMDRTFTFLKLDDIFVETTIRFQRGSHEFLAVKLFAVSFLSKGEAHV
ncbi:MAG TPA: hypothetical protein VKR06_03930 [Ktedonosporobacter sp.]|nr:hypothetical protein [Ktedonosporobacter sp.]